MMIWLKKHYDLAILGFASLLFLTNAALIIQSALSANEQLAPPATLSPNNTLPEFNPVGLQVSEAPIWEYSANSPDKASLLASRTYLLKDGKLFDPIEGSENLHHPITNEWLIEHDLDYTAKDIKHRDSDGDGFSNLEEFLAGTTPTNKESKPAAYNKLKLVGFKSLPFRIIFKGDPSGAGKEFQINFLELKGAAATQYRKLGDVIDGAPYKIVNYDEKKFTDNRGIPVDQSALTIENINNGNQIVLIKDKQTDDPSSEGTFLNQISGSTFVKKKGETFVLEPDRIEFKIIDITPTSAQIQDTRSGKTYQITKADPSNSQ